ncbi:hypothetical protein KKI23_00610 [Patescibacteria group bacterium]|nr:hypothetical protein [Patescibacteria group bacterium]
MYLYIYDSYLKDKKFEITLNKIEARLSDLSINGRIAKMTILKNIKEAVEDGIKKGATTIVAVGNDQTLFDVIRSLASQLVTVGFIPVHCKSQIAQTLDIPPDDKACDTLSARLTVKLDVGKINKHFFLSSVEIDQGQVSIECDGRYWVTPLSPASSVQICNFGYWSTCRQKTVCHSNPQDGYLEAIIQPVNSQRNIFGFKSQQQNQASVFSAKKLKIVSQTESVPISVDGEMVAKTPVSIEVVPQKLNIIVGKKRMF